MVSYPWGGLNYLDINKEIFTYFTHDPDNKNSISNDYINAICTDDSGYIWLGTTGGINRFNPKTQNFSHIRNDPDDINSLGSEYINNLYFDSLGQLWIGTLGSGVDCFNPESQRFIHFRNDQNDDKSLSNNFIWAIYQDRIGNLWIGTQNGLNKLEASQLSEINTSNQLSDTSFKRFIHNPQDEFSISGNWVIDITEDSVNLSGRRGKNGTLWIGTDKGLIKYNYKTQKYFRYFNIPSDPNSLCNDYIGHVYPDPRDENIIWIATSGGLSRFDIALEKMTSFKHDPVDPGSISNNASYFVHRDNNGTLWIATEAGFNRMNEINNTFKYYTEKDGLPNSFVTSIMEDNHTQLWLGTLGGLSHFNPKTEIFKNYDASDGLQGNEFWLLSAMKDKNGWLYFGGTNGFNFFHPDSIKINTRVPDLVFTDFELFNRVQFPGADSPIKKSLSEVDDITLAYDQENFTIKFAALDYNAPGKNQYAYKMEGVDRNWIYTNAGRRFATYTKLDPGDYIFRVKGSNNDGIWNEKDANINITVLPPWRRANLAYFTYIILGIALIGTLWRLQMNRIRMRHQREMEHLDNEKLKEVDQAKPKFFTNISHEFRTPLTLIESPIKQFLDADLKEHCKVVLKNTRRLLDLVNQLLDLSKLESGHVKLKACRQNLIPLVSGLVQSFESLAVKRNIGFTFKTDLSELEIYLDTEKFEKIITNLLSNAFKFTPEDGEISVLLSMGTRKLNRVNTDRNESIQITITNSGREFLPGRFQRFLTTFIR